MPPSGAVQTSFPVIDGLPLEVHLSGPPDVPTLVFLHEGLGSAGLWRDFPAKLAGATGCAALVYSRAGYGQSGPVILPRPVTYLHHEALVVLPELLAHLNVQNHILIGHSDGGSIALINAGGAARPGLLGVITEAAHVFNEPMIPPAIREAVEQYENGDLRAKLARYHQHVDVAFRGWSDTWLSQEFTHWNLEEYIPGIRVPLLVIQGEDDHYGSEKQVDAIVNQAGVWAQKLMLPGCAHTPHREAAQATFEAMQEFIKPLVKVPRGGV